FIQGDSVGPDSHVLGLVGNFLVSLHSSLAAGDPAEGANLKFPPIALLVEFDEHVIGGVATIRNVQIKRWLAFPDNVFGCRSFYFGIPMLVPQTIGEKTARLAANFHVGHR